MLKRAWCEVSGAPLKSQRLGVTWGLEAWLVPLGSSCNLRPNWFQKDPAKASVA